MTKFADNLWRDLTREHGAALTQADRPEAGRTRRPSSRVIAGSTLAVAAVSAAVTLGLTSAGSTTAGGTQVVTDAFTITQSSSGSVLVQINQEESIVAANKKLNAMVKEQVSIQTATGPAPVKGPVTCTPSGSNAGGSAVKVLLGTDGTEVIAPGTTGRNTGVGTWHLASCSVSSTADANAGNTGVG
jgi:hypothetical protein